MSSFVATLQFKKPAGNSIFQIKNLLSRKNCITNISVDGDILLCQFHFSVYGKNFFYEKFSSARNKMLLIEEMVVDRTKIKHPFRILHVFSVSNNGTREKIDVNTFFKPRENKAPKQSKFFKYSESSEEDDDTFSSESTHIYAEETNERVLKKHQISSRKDYLKVPP